MSRVAENCFRGQTKTMKSRFLIPCLLAVTATALFPSCLMRQTVTQNGEVISSDYVVKRPIKNVIKNSQTTP